MDDAMNGRRRRMVALGAVLALALVVTACGVPGAG